MVKNFTQFGRHVVKSFHQSLNMIFQTRNALSTFLPNKYF